MRTTWHSRASSSIANFLRRLRDRTRKLIVEPGTVCYFPRFKDAEDLANHFFRATWYLPHQPGRCNRVTFCVAPPIADVTSLGACPPDMAPPEGSTDHLKIRSGVVTMVRAILSADLVLIWRARRWAGLAARLRRLGLRIVVVDTREPAAREYVQYAVLLWQELTPARDREKLRRTEHSRFRALVDRLRGEVSDHAFVFGTGPTLNRSPQHRFDGALRVACNTIVASPELLEHIAPHIIAAADVVSHFGVSLYAARFRQALVECLRKHRTTFVTTTALGNLLLAHHPDLRDRVLMVPYGGSEPCLDLVDDFRAPSLESVLNSFMLPLATTFCRHVHLIGCDGKQPSGANEDFWPHAEQAHFADLVDTGHRCHPTFHVNRQDGGYERYDADVRKTISAGRARGFTYNCLYPSHLPALQPYSPPADPE